MTEVNQLRRDGSGSTSWMRTKTEGKAVGTLHEGVNQLRRDGSGSTSWMRTKTKGKAVGRGLNQNERQWDEDYDRRKGSGNAA